uniref:Fish virus induced TRIM protein n=1 Tax=Oncorhynchus mykiss TaxID=8022 RepID=A0A8K9XJZ9_ONCMY
MSILFNVDSFQEQFQCSICLDVFTEPVSTPCGHNFCKVCISGYWDTTDLCQCPMCKRTFYTRPELNINTAFRDVVDYVNRIRVKNREKSPAEAGEVVCDICTRIKLKALKSCLECQTSFCETHLQPHQRVTGLKRHKLIDPVENMEDRMCKKHDRQLELFCRTDQTCVCQFCTEADHKTHHTVPLEKEFGERKAQLVKTEQHVWQMIQERLEKVQKIKHSELIEEVEEKQKAAENQAEGFIEELEQEITDLHRRHTELEQLSHTEDHLHLLQIFPSLYTTPNIKDWSEISVYSETCVGNLRSVLRSFVSELEKTVRRAFSEKFTNAMEDFHDINLKKMQQYAVDVTLDPDTAYDRVVQSKDKKQLRKGRKNLPDNTDRFR